MTFFLKMHIAWSHVKQQWETLSSQEGHLQQRVTKAISVVLSAKRWLRRENSTGLFTSDVVVMPLLHKPLLMPWAADTVLVPRAAGVTPWDHPEWADSSLLRAPSWEGAFRTKMAFLEIAVPWSGDEDHRHAEPLWAVHVLPLRVVISWIPWQPVRRESATAWWALVGRYDSFSPICQLLTRKLHNRSISNKLGEKRKC